MHTPRMYFFFALHIRKLHPYSITEMALRHYITALRHYGILVPYSKMNAYTVSCFALLNGPTQMQITTNM